MKSKNNKLYLLLLLLLMITIGYASLSKVLNITGTSKLDDNIKWDVHFKEGSTSVTEGSVSTTAPTIDTNKTTVTYTADLKKPNDFYEFTLDVVNEGSIDVMLNEIIKTTLEGETAADTTYLNSYIDYTVTYEDGVSLNKDNNKDLLKATTGKETLKVRVAIKDVDNLPTPKTLTFKLQLNYVQADNGAKEREHKLCKRATSLHTENCNNTDSENYCQADGYKNGKTIIYGNLKNGNTLTSGDAFDCDVNGDGVYDSAKERFYYVSDYYDTETGSFDDTKVTLIYYNNISGGLPNTLAPFAYNKDNINNLGPLTSAPELPTIEKWSNNKIIRPSLRQILNEKGINTTNNGQKTINTFDYSNYAARLLTTQELEKACNAKSGQYIRGELSGCKYLYENTKYANDNVVDGGYWLETPRSDHVSTTWHVSVIYRRIGSVDSKVARAVRPVITALKRDII